MNPDAICLCDHPYESHKPDGKHCEEDFCECAYFEPLSDHTAPDPSPDAGVGADNSGVGSPAGVSQTRVSADPGAHSLDENGVNEFGVAMCECKGQGYVHAWEPGEWCSPERVVPAPDPSPGESGEACEGGPAVCGNCTCGALAGDAKLTPEQREQAEAEGAASGRCPFCEGGMDAFGGVHTKDCPLSKPPQDSGDAIELLGRIYNFKADHRLDDDGMAVEWIEKEIADFIRKHGPFASHQSEEGA